MPCVIDNKLYMLGIVRNDGGKLAGQGSTAAALCCESKGGSFYNKHGSPSLSDVVELQAYEGEGTTMDIAEHALCWQVSWVSVLAHRLSSVCRYVLRSSTRFLLKKTTMRQHSQNIICFI